MRDYWNNVEVKDEEKLKEEIIAIVNAAKPLTYSEMQELRISSELCDRSHFKWAVDRLAAKTGAKVPADLDIVLEDPDFDVRVSFMKDVVKATDPAPVQPRAHR